MITDVIRKISREHTLVLTERGRDDVTLPSDLWKRSVSNFYVIFVVIFVVILVVILVVTLLVILVIILVVILQGQ